MDVPPSSSHLFLVADEKPLSEESYLLYMSNKKHLVLQVASLTFILAVSQSRMTVIQLRVTEC